MKRYLWEVSALVICMLILHVMFAMQLVPLLCVGGAGLFLLPVVNRCIRRIYGKKAEYFELTAYMEQLICSYKRLGTISPALEDCRTLYPEESQMGKVLQQALYILKTGEGAGDHTIVETALAKIQDLYPSRRLQLLHGFLCKAEKVGGDRTEELDILLRDMQSWKRRVILYQKKKQFIRSESVFAVVMSVLLCYLSLCLIPWNLRNILIRTRIFQYSTAIVIIVLMTAEVVLLYRLTGSWLDIFAQSERDAIRLQKSYRKVKDQKKGITGYMAKKICQREVEREFPYWLLSLTLYLQQGGVYQAVRLSQSMREEGFFQEEVRRLLGAIYDDPVSLHPYLAFFRELELTEIQTGMKLLYAVNSNDYKDMGRQIRLLVEQNNVVMDQCEKKQFDSQIAGMGFLKQIPMILACAKVVFDLILLLMLTMGKYLVL